MQTPQYFLDAASAAFQRQNFPAAEAHCREGLSLHADDVDLLSVLGVVLMAQRKHADAETTFDRLTALQPDEPSHWSNLGTARRGRADLDGALEAFTAAARRGANSSDFYFNVGMTHIDRRDFESARAVLAQALSLAPQDAELRLHYASSCYERLKSEDARAALEHWEDCDGLNGDIMVGIGQVLMKLGDSEGAGSAIRRAISIDPSDPQAALTLIQLLERTNHLDDAQREMIRLEKNPLAATLGSDLKLMRAQLAQRAGDHAAAIALFGELLAECKEFEQRHLLEFPLAKSLDAVHRFELAFDSLLAAHDSQTALFKMTAPLLSVRGAPSMVITRFGCDPDDVAAWVDERAPPLEDSPVFIVAFPRSGTTLLELTLDSHSALVSMDEQPLMQQSLDDMTLDGVAYPEAMRGLTAEHLERLRAQYWDRASRIVHRNPGQRLIDKNPLNILRLPVMRRLFPHAPIILAIRHPCDVLLSCFMQHFRTPDFALLCSDLETLAVGYRRAFDFWYSQSALLKPNAIELRYETLTGDFAGQVGGLLDFLHLPWEKSVLRPHETARAKGYISTPSYSQVIEPVSSKSVGRWHSFESHFQPILPIVAPYLERWGYDGLGSSNNK